MGNAILALGLQFLHAIVQKEIDENGIEPRPRVLSLNLPPQKLDAPDAAPAQLDLPGVTALDDLLPPDVRLQRRTVLEAAEGVEHLGNPVVCEHGDVVDVVEVAVAFALEAGPEVGDEDLGALVEADRAGFVVVAVVEAGEVVHEEVDEGGGGSFAFLDACGEGSAKPIFQYVARLS